MCKCVLGSELLPMIKAGSKSERHSENLMKWVCKYQDKPMFVAIATAGEIGVGNKCLVFFEPEKNLSHLLYVGWFNLDDGYLHGSPLNEILSNGAGAKTWPFPPMLQFVEVSGWWERYIQLGKCCIDPEHWLYAGRERWKVSSDGKSRSCLWCGTYEQCLHTEMVPKRTWRQYQHKSEVVCAVG